MYHNRCHIQIFLIYRFLYSDLFFQEFYLNVNIFCVHRIFLCIFCFFLNLQSVVKAKNLENDETFRTFHYLSGLKMNVFINYPHDRCDIQHCAKVWIFIKTAFLQNLKLNQSIHNIFSIMSDVFKLSSIKSLL